MQLQSSQAEWPVGSGAILDTVCLGDIDAIVAIEVSCFPVPWRREYFVAEVGQLHRYNRVLRSFQLPPLAPAARGRTIGYLFAYHIFEEMHINKIAVQPDAQGHGYGDQLMRDCLAFAAEQGVRSVTLEVRPSNDRAIDFYRRLGFRVLRRRPAYYSDGEDALILGKELN